MVHALHSSVSHPLFPFSSHHYTSRKSQTTRNVYWSLASVCLSVCPSFRMPMLLHGPRCNLGEWQGCPLFVYYWADLQSVHRFHCYDIIAQTRNVSECLYPLYVWLSVSVQFYQKPTVSQVIIIVLFWFLFFLPVFEVPCCHKEHVQQRAFLFEMLLYSLQQR